mgnify:CR=1 FL=1
MNISSIILAIAKALTGNRSTTQAMWRKHLLMPAGGKKNPSGSGIWDGSINYAAELDIEQEETTEGQNPLDQKGGDKAKEFSISVQVNKIADGTDPLKTYKKWQDSLGKKGYFYIGKKPIDKSMYMLKQVDFSCSNTDFAADGMPYRADITLTFTEDVVEKRAGQEIKAAAEAGTTKKTATKSAKKSEKKEKKVATWDIKKGGWSDE